MTARKKTAEKASTKKPSTKKASTKKAATKKAATKKASTAAGKKAGSDGGKSVSSTDVNRMNLFTLRPRVNTAFRQEDFLEARRILEDETYSSLEQAARAVAEKALSLSNDPKGRPGQLKQKPKRR